MQVQKVDNSTILEAITDVFHGSLLAKLPARSLILLSMVSTRVKQFVDTTPRDLTCGNKIVVAIVVFYVDRLTLDEIKIGPWILVFKDQFTVRLNQINTVQIKI
jgi:hypothetical protein